MYLNVKCHTYVGDFCICNEKEGVFEPITDHGWVSHHCRDIIASAWGKEALIYISKENPKCIIDLLSNVENIMGIKSQIGMLANRKGIWIKPDKVWMKRRIMKSLLTALIKAGEEYNGGDLIKHVKKSQYFSTGDRDKALKHILDGNIEYYGISSRDAYYGWMEAVGGGNHCKIFRKAKCQLKNTKNNKKTFLVDKDASP